MRGHKSPFAAAGTRCGISKRDQVHLLLQLYRSWSLMRQLHNGTMPIQHAYADGACLGPQGSPRQLPLSELPICYT